MYQTHWGLEKSPFPSGLDPRLFFEGASQRESLARLRFLLTHQRRLGLLLGESGSGKSLLLSVFAQQCQTAGYDVAKVDLLGLSVREFFWQLGNSLQAAVRVEDDLPRLFRQLTDRFYENQLQNKSTVLLLDDLDQAGPDLLNQVLRLLRTDAAQSGWLQLVATANSNQLSRLGKSLLELADLRIDLLPWDELDTIGYVQMALVEAGAERPLFDDEAIAELHRVSQGVPRAVNRLADLALLVAAENSQELVNTSVIQATCESNQVLSLDG